MTATRPHWHLYSGLARLGRTVIGLAAAVILAGLLAGVPYALTRWIGWPLPRRWPTSAQWHTMLSSPVTDQLLLDVLACLCWLTWAVFVTDVARAIPDAVRHAYRTQPATSARAPLRALATVLLGAILTSLLASRQPPLIHATIAPSAADHRLAKHPITATTSATTEHLTATLAGTSTVTVEPPHNGIHDSLWRIAARCLGDGARWPEIYHLNEGRLQPGGGVLTVPSLIQPGWVLQLPEAATTAPPPGRPPTGPRQPQRPGPHRVPPPHPGVTRAPAPDSRSSTSSSPDHPGDRTSAAPAPRSTTHDGRDRPGGGVDLGDGVYVSLGLAAAVSASLIVIRRRNRRWYVPGSGRRDDLPVAPIVRSLHLAHLRATAPPDGEPDEESGEDTVDCDTEDHDAPGEAVAPHRTGQPPDSVANGTGPRFLIDLAAQGAGLVGAGADDVLRAAMLELLTASEGRTAADVLMPAADVEHLLGQHLSPSALPSRLHVVSDLKAALDQLEAATVHRTRTATTVDDRVIVLVARPGEDTARLQAVLDNGATYGIAALLLGQWRAGTSLYIGGDGIVSATNDVNDTLRGTRLPTLPATAAQSLLSLIHAGEHGAEVPPGQQPAAQRANRADVATVVAPTAQLEPPEGEPPPQTARAQAPHPSAADRPAASLIRHQSDRDPGSAPPVPLALRILGSVSLTWTPDSGRDRDAPIQIVGALSLRLRELLVLLALHPDGVSRDRLADTLWPDAPPDRPHNNLTTNLSRLRAGIARATEGQVSAVVLASGDQLRVDPSLVRVDYRDFADAAADGRDASTDAARADAWRCIVTAYGGELADGLGAEWLETPREAIRRDAIDAATRLARAVAASDPQHALDLLETARARDPYNEQLYRDIMRVQRRLGHTDAIGRTLTLLATRLGELGETPSNETVDLVAALQRLTPAAADAASARTGPGGR